MSLKRLSFLLLLGFGLFFLTQQPGEAAKLVKLTGENAQELFSTAGDAFIEFMTSLI